MLNIRMIGIDRTHNTDKIEIESFEGRDTMSAGHINQHDVEQIVLRLCSGLKPLFPQGTMDVILFGSYARGEADADSDIDVMILVESPRQDISEKTWEIGSVAADLLLDSGVVISPIVENKDYFREHASFLPLYKNIVREGVRYSA